MINYEIKKSSPTQTFYKNILHWSFGDKNISFNYWSDYRIRHCLVPPKTTVTLPNSEVWGLDKGDFYFHQIYKKLVKNLSQSNFLIYYDFIKNNSYINLDYGNHIWIVWSGSNAVKTHNVNIFHKNLASWRPVAKTLHKYNSYRLEENEEEENESINIELSE